MNMQIGIAFGDYVARIPLRKAATIIHGNALQVDWGNIIVSYPWEKGEARYDFILGNPPFLGSRIMNKDQKSDLIEVFDGAKDIGELDYVTGWYIKAAKYCFNTTTEVAFVSTNSIVQGLQPPILWSQLGKFNTTINFAHRTFKWSNEAKGNAAVYCVIIGFSTFSRKNKYLFDYQDISGDAQKVEVNNINPYLVDAKNILITRRQKPICNVPEMNFGNMPADGGEFLFTDEEKKLFVNEEPESEKYFKQILSANEFINGKIRWCLWLEGIEPSELRKSKLVLERINNVKKIREESSRPQLANTPHLFAQITQPKGVGFILIPRHSSENRQFIPIGIFDATYIASDSCMLIPTEELLHFGILTSTMHMAWVKTVCGRLKSDFRYSKDIVYNNFPWPENPTEKQKQAVEQAAQQVLDARAQFPNSSLADLYDPLTMPPALVKAHQQLDKAVDQCYRSAPFTSEAKRMEFLFELYEKYTAGLLAGEKKKGKVKS